MQPLKILLIEDSAAEARLIRELLAEAPEGRVDLHHSASLATGLETLTEDGADVVLLDLSLPDSHGLETLRSVRAAVSRIPVIVLTGSDEEELALSAVEKGAQDYLVKGQVDGKAILRAARYAIARARTLEALRESQRFIHQVAELLYVINPETLEIDHVSPQLEALIGGAPGSGESRSKRFDELVHPDDQQALRRRMRDARTLSDDEVVESEFRIRTAEGWCWLLARETLFMRGANGSPDLLLGTAQLLTNRQAEDVLNSEINLLKNVFDALPQPIFVKDSNGRFLLSNAAHRRLLGIPEAGQIVGKTDFELLPSEEAERNLAAEQALLQGASQAKLERPANARAEMVRKTVFHKTPLRNETGAVIGLLAVGDPKA
jgi:DNA-binding NarL/FixJ family response regulator